ncbi:DUF2541 domain-containing protein [Robertkochia solimangrovi]|uniref:DUF2541 domain-containing protein n=1 Tax=Robertkochia solimangrovi TaxID=2213046 RepID=UPI00117EF545|nr:DUF2541 domain-containing protein [Robertkochia solimangrovi]TRZ46103.1 DUF2541 domain-containing protein [Robertkochia solimangrovi]
MKTLLVVSLFLITTFVSYTQGDNWIKLADKYVAFKTEKDKVSVSGKEKSVDKIKITCVQGTVQIKSIKIVMANGKEKEYDAKGIGVMTKGMSSLNYSVPDKDEKIKYIELEYDSKGSIVTNKRAKVEIWGKKGGDDD